MKKDTSAKLNEVQSWFDFQVSHWFDFQVSQYGIIQMLVLGLLLFLFLRFLKQILNKKIQYKDFLERTWAVGEFIVWVLFLIASTRHIILNPLHSYYVIIVLVLVLLIWIAWFALRDLVAGIILKLEGSVGLNEKVIINNISGNITKLSYLSLMLETDTGQKVSLPYHLVKNKEKIKDTVNNVIHKVSLKLKIDKQFTATQIQEKLQKYILNSPWIVPTQTPIIFLEKENMDSYQFNITIFLLNKKYILKFKEVIASKIDSLIFE